MGDAQQREACQVLAQAACTHEDRTGANDYLRCSECGLMWDYRREGPQDGLVRDLIAAIRRQGRRACQCSEPDPVMQADGKFYCHTCSFETGARPLRLEPESLMRQLAEMTAERDKMKAELKTIQRIAKADSIEDMLKHTSEGDTEFRLRMFCAIASLRVELMANKGHADLVQRACDTAVTNLQRAERAERRAAQAAQLVQKIADELRRGTIERPRGAFGRFRLKIAAQIEEALAAVRPE